MPHNDMTWSRGPVPARPRKKTQRPGKRRAARSGDGGGARGGRPMRLVICFWMVISSSLFFVLARYQYDYLGRVHDMAAQPLGDWEHVAKVHGFYVKTFITNLCLGGVAVAAGLAMAGGWTRLATAAIWFWLTALAVSQGLTLYTMTADNIIFETYLKAGVATAVLAMLLVRRGLKSARQR